MRRERAARREQTGSVNLAAAAAGKSGKKVIEAKHVGFGYGERTHVSDFSTVVQRGDKLGLIGPNGSGKTTLLKLLLGQLQPQRGARDMAFGQQCFQHHQQVEIDSA